MPTAASTTYGTASNVSDDTTVPASSRCDRSIAARAQCSVSATHQRSMSLASSATNQSSCFPVLETTEKLRSSTRKRTVASPWRTKLPAGLPGANKVAADRVDECTSRSSYHFSLDVDSTKNRRTGSRFIRNEDVACMVRKPLRLLGTALASFFKASTSRGACDSSIGDLFARGDGAAHEIHRAGVHITTGALQGVQR